MTHNQSLIEKIRALRPKDDYDVYAKAGYFLAILDAIYIIRQHFSSPDVVERVATAMYPLDTPWENVADVSRDVWRGYAKAAIATIMGDASTRKDEVSIGAISDDIDLAKQSQSPAKMSEIRSLLKSLQGYLQALEPDKVVTYDYVNRLWDHYMPKLFNAVATMGESVQPETAAPYNGQTESEGSRSLPSPSPTNYTNTPVSIHSKQDVNKPIYISLAMYDLIKQALEPFMPGKIVSYNDKEATVTISYQQYRALVQAASALHTTIKPVSCKPNAAEALYKAILEAHAKWAAEYEGVGHVD